MVSIGVWWMERSAAGDYTRKPDMEGRLRCRLAPNCPDPRHFTALLTI